MKGLGYANKLAFLEIMRAIWVAQAGNSSRVVQAIDVDRVMTPSYLPVSFQHLNSEERKKEKTMLAEKLSLRQLRKCISISDHC